MKFIDAEQVSRAVTPIQLVNAIEAGFAGQTQAPLRQHFDIYNPFSSRETTLLMMPAWQEGKQIGVKLVTVAPDNAQYQLPSIQGVYLLFDAVKGQVQAMLDAPALTAKRTAAASALGSRFLSREESSHLLMIGTGILAPELIKAHACVRPINRVSVWGRDQAKAEAVRHQLVDSGLSVQVVTDLEKAVKEADIVSCATLSQEPLLNGHWLKPGQHIDLVGAYRPDMREADDECIRRSRIVVDNYTGACKETGDIAIPLAEGVLRRDDIEADLFELCRGQVTLTRQAEDITLFKSVGHALEDLASAQLIYSTIEDDHVEQF